MLHNHSYYSLLTGSIPVGILVDRAKSFGNKHIALSDLNNMYGVVKFAKAAAAAGITPVFGAVINDPVSENMEALFLARNNHGYSDLCSLVSSRKINNQFRLLDIFNKKLDNFFIITPSLSLLLILRDRGVLRDNVYAELIPTERNMNSMLRLYEFARETGIPYVASHPAYFLNPDDFMLHKLLTAIRLNTTIENLKNSDTVDPEYYLRKPGEVARLWRNFPGALENAEYILSHCNVDIKVGKYKFPVFNLPFEDTPFSYLWKICFRELEEKEGYISKDAAARLQHELNIIDQLGFCNYFLIVWDIVREARRRGIACIGRGSVGNSLVAYALGMSQINPLEQGLYFERFLNLGRRTPPDIDLDFSWKERDGIVKYLYDKYGYNKVSMISTMVTFKARSAFRKTAKAFGITDEEISKYSRFIPWTSALNLKAISDKYPESGSLKFNREPWKTIIELAYRLADFPHHLSIHPGGIVVAPEAITNYIPLEFVSNKGLGLIVTQPDMYSVEDLGLIKIDLLSQRSLGVLRDTLKQIRSNS